MYGTPPLLFLLLPTFPAPIFTLQTEEIWSDNIITRGLAQCLNPIQEIECLQVHSSKEGRSTLEIFLNSDITSFTFPRISKKVSETPKLLTPFSGQPSPAIDRLWESLDDLANSRLIAINISELHEEGRVKKKTKLLKYLVVALITAAVVLIPIKLKLIAWVAASAFLIGKVALLLASLAGLQTLVSKSHEEKTHVHRSDQAHYLAYGGYELAPGDSIDY